MFLCFCCDAANESPSWSDALRRPARRGKEWSASALRVKEAASTFCQKSRNLFRKLNKTNNGAMHSSNQTKSGRFQYDALSYALNFDNGCADEDDYSPRAFSARFACPIAKPRGAENP